MKRIFFSIILTFAAFSIVSAQTANKNKKIEQELLKIEQEMNDAYNRRDKATILRYLADDYFEAAPNGKIFDRITVASRAEKNPPELKFKDVISEVRLLVEGNMAVMNYRIDAQVQGGEKNGRVYSTRVTDVFTRKAGRWLIAASHASDIEQTQPGK